MKKMFSGFYAPSDIEIKEAWLDEKTLFVFDTNVLLNLYSYTDVTRKDFFKILEKISNNIWIPYHVGLEYQRNRVNIINDDPRNFMKQTRVKFDGIFISPVSPVTLVGNRLFTIEAFALMKKCLSVNGVLSLQVSGSENYLGSIKAKIILGTNNALRTLFSDVYAFPGHPITQVL